MSLQIIKSITGREEYALVPMKVYRVLRVKIEKALLHLEHKNEYETFDPADYVDNPVALARICAHLTQEELAKRLKVSQAYISKVERQKKVSTKLLVRVHKVLGKK